MNLFVLFCYVWVLAQSDDDFQLCLEANEAGYWQGLDGWIFSQSDLRTDFPVLVEEVKRLGKAFRDQGILVVFVALPPRALLAYNYLDRSKEPFTDYSHDSVIEAYREFLGVFENSGFTTIDLSSFDDSLFFKTDHHWTPAGARMAAQAVTERAKDLLDLPETIFVTSLLPDSISRQGSYVKSILSETVCPALEIPDEIYPHYVTTRLNPQELGLFGEVSSEVILIGSSNSTNGVGVGFENNPQVNFIGFLQGFLQTDVLNFAISGGSSFIALENYLISEAYNHSKPKLLVWEITLNPRLLDRSRFDQATDYRRVIPSIYGSCTKSGVVLEGTLNVSSVKPRFLSRVESDSWRVHDAVVESKVIKVLEGDADTYTVTFVDEGASLIFPYQAGQVLGNQLLTTSFWAWTSSQQPVEVRLTFTTQPNREERFSRRVSLNSTPQQLMIDNVFLAETFDTGFNLRLDGMASGTTLYISAPEIVKSEQVLLVNEDYPIQGHNFYLELEATDVSLVDFNVVFEYQNGDIERVPMRRDERIQNTGRYFLELSDSFTSFLHEVRLELPISTTGLIEARVCQIQH